jgi:EpsI family protein
MESAPASQPTPTRAWGPAAACALAGAAVFQFFGNASRGYIDTASLFHWWGWQWFDAASETEHGVIILAVSGWLFWRNLKIADRRSAIADCAPKQSPIANWQSAIAMAAGLALHAVGFVAQQARLSILALLIFTWGVLRLAGGRRWGAAALFPLVFLVFAIPVNVLDSVGFWLRMSVVRVSAAVAHGVGIDVLRSGTQLIAPDGRYQYDVAAACSGVRSLTALVALAALAGYLSFRSFGRRTVVLLLCAPLVWIGNVARLTAIIFAAQAGGQAWGERAHDIMGVGVFAIVLGGLLAAIRLIEKRWPEAEDGGPKTEDRSASEARVFRPPTSVLCSAVIVLAVAEMIFLQRITALPPRGGAGVALAPDGKNPVELPTFLGAQWIGQDAAVTAIEREILPKDTGFSRKAYLSHRDPTKAVLLSIVLSGRDRTSIHRPELCLVGQGWTLTESGAQAFAFPARGKFPATLLRVRKETPTTRGTQVTTQLVAYWFVSEDAVVATHWERIARDAWNRVTRARADRWAYVLMQTDAADGEAAGLARMQAVLDGTLPAFQRGP